MNTCILCMYIIMSIYVMFLRVDMFFGVAYVCMYNMVITQII